MVRNAKQVILVVGALVLLGGIVAAGSWYGGGSSSTADNSSVQVTAGPGSVFVGDAAAPVKVVIYEDFLSPPCRRLEASTRDFLRENAAKGKVQVEYRPVSLLIEHPYSARALAAWGAVLQHASPQAALKLHDLLFEEQPDLETSARTKRADLAALVSEVGADTAAVTAALRDPDTAFLAEATFAVKSEGITSLPAVLVDGQLLPRMTVADLRTRIETAVARAP